MLTEVQHHLLRTPVLSGHVAWLDMPSSVPMLDVKPPGRPRQTWLHQMAPQPPSAKNGTLQSDVVDIVGEPDCRYGPPLPRRSDDVTEQPITQFL